MSSVITLDQDVSVARATLNADRTSIKKIEIANLAVFEAIKSLAGDYKNPIAANLFGADWEVLEALASATKSKVLPLFQTGVPIFGVRTSPEMRQMLINTRFDGDALLTMLLKTFENSVPLSEL